MNNDYQRWLAGNDCCGQVEKRCCCDSGDSCSCDDIWLELSKQHTDDLVLQDEIDYISGITDTKLDASAYTPVDLSDYYTKEEVDELIPDVPSLSGYATEQWVSNNYQIKGNYLTEHQPLKTINGQVISGTGNIEITASGGSINVDYVLDSGSTNPVANSAITVAINNKLDASAYTPTEQVQSDWNVSDSASTAYIKNKPTIPSLAGYATEQWVLDKHYITGVDLSDYALKSELPTVPTSNSAFTNDEHFITSGDSVFNNYALTANTYTKTEVDSKFWCGTQAEYDALQNKRNDVLYLIHE